MPEDVCRFCLDRRTLSAGRGRFPSERAVPSAHGMNSQAEDLRQRVEHFAVERIHDASLLEERFTPIEELPDDAFPHSLGVHLGPPERVEIEFQPAAAEVCSRARVASVAAAPRGAERRRGDDPEG